MNSEWIKNNLAWLIPVALSALTGSGAGISYVVNSFIESEQLIGYDRGKKEMESKVDSIRTVKNNTYENYHKAMRDAMYWRLKYEFVSGTGPEPIGQLSIEPEEWTEPPIQP